MVLRCIECEKKYSISDRRYVCDCDGLLEVVYGYENIDVGRWSERRMGVWRYRELLPVFDERRIVSLGEGATNLYDCQKLAKRLGLRKVLVKNEGENPTGSFKDRGITVGITKAIEYGFDCVGCASTGNTAASLAAYAAKAGLRGVVFIPSERVTLGKLSQALVHGATVLAVRGSFDQAMALIKEVAFRGDVYLLNSLNPHRLEGQKTIGFEVADALGWKVPDRVVLPVGNAGNISAVWKAFKELQLVGLTESRPMMAGIQAAGAAPIVDLFMHQKTELEGVAEPKTVATAIRIGNPVSWPKAIKAITESDGLAESVTDEEILAAQRLLAQTEGIFVEPASAASIAGLIRLRHLGSIDGEETVVCIATGHGLKDPDIVVGSYQDSIVEVAPCCDEIEEVLFAKRRFVRG